MAKAQTAVGQRQALRETALMGQAKRRGHKNPAEYARFYLLSEEIDRIPWSGNREGDRLGKAFSEEIAEEFRSRDGVRSKKELAVFAANADRCIYYWLDRGECVEESLIEFRNLVRIAAGLNEVRSGRLTEDLSFDDAAGQLLNETAVPRVLFGESLDSRKSPLQHEAVLMAGRTMAEAIEKFNAAVSPTFFGESEERAA